MVSPAGNHRASDKALLVTQIAEIFREYGFEGTSLSQITQRTGLGKGSLYHVFPAGKDEMASAVLAQVTAWFTLHIFQPLEDELPGPGRWDAMWQAVEDYFRSGQRICLMGVFAQDRTRDRFTAAISAYFIRWIAALRRALIRVGVDDAVATALAEDAIGGIQGALILSRALNDPTFFGRSLRRLRQRIDTAVPSV